MRKNIATVLSKLTKPNFGVDYHAWTQRRSEEIRSNGVFLLAIAILMSACESREFIERQLDSLLAKPRQSDLSEKEVTLLKKMVGTKAKRKVLVWCANNYTKVRVCTEIYQHLWADEDPIAFQSFAQGLCEYGDDSDPVFWQHKESALAAMLGLPETCRPVRLRKTFSVSELAKRVPKLDPSSTNLSILGLLLHPSQNCADSYRKALSEPDSRSVELLARAMLRSQCEMFVTLLENDSRVAELIREPIRKELIEPAQTFAMTLRRSQLLQSMHLARMLYPSETEHLFLKAIRDSRWSQEKLPRERDINGLRELVASHDIPIREAILDYLEANHVSWAIEPNDADRGDFRDQLLGIYQLGLAVERVGRLSLSQEIQESVAIHLRKEVNAILAKPQSEIARYIATKSWQNPFRDELLTALATRGITLVAVQFPNHWSGVSTTIYKSIMDVVTARLEVSGGERFMMIVCVLQESCNGMTHKIRIDLVVTQNDLCYYGEWATINGKCLRRGKRMRLLLFYAANGRTSGPTSFIGETPTKVEYWDIKGMHSGPPDTLLLELAADQLTTAIAKKELNLPFNSH